MGQILVVGKPNSGKSLLFNRLTGLRQKVANFPGVTVEVKRGNFEDMELVDFPGVYSLSPLTNDEIVAVEKFKASLNGELNKVILCLLDATRLEKSLVLGLQVKKEAEINNVPIIFALNMIDEVMHKKLNIDHEALSDEIGAPVISISAKTGHGIDDLKTIIRDYSSCKMQNKWDISNEEILVRARELNTKFGAPAGIILSSQNKLDKLFLSNIWGGALFFLIMLFLFQAIFTWASPFMDGVEEIIGQLASLTVATLPDGAVKDFITDAFFGGIGGFLVFVPQIFILTFIIGMLEDSGYLARAAIICHRPFSYFGLSGKSFIPLLSGYACAIPGIMAARTIESPVKRFLTILAVPFTSCSARLPVYTLLIAVFIPSESIMGGLINLQGLVFFLVYIFGIVVAMTMTSLMSKFIYKDSLEAPFVLELPPYRAPSFVASLRKSGRSALMFIKKAGPVIFAVSVVIWALGYFPNGSGQLESSYLAKIGQYVGPIFEPMGLDWKYAVAIITSFLAREVFVGTLGTLFGIDGADENIGSLVDQVSSQGLPFASGIALLVFYALAMQCVATLAVIKQETNTKTAVSVFFGYSLLAYVLSMLTYYIIL